MPYGGITLLMALGCWGAAGIIVGLLFGIIMGTGKHGGFLGFVLLGLIGAILSGFLYSLFGSMDSFTWQVNIMVGIIGAVILVVIGENAHRRFSPHKNQKPKH